MTKKLNYLYLLLNFSILFNLNSSLSACTGISLWSNDKCYLQARTIEWAAGNLNSQMVIIPRGYKMTSMVPQDGNGLSFTSKYGVVGISTVEAEIITEAVNEMGLSAGLFFFKGYGSYEPYNPKYNASTLCDLQLVTWMLTQFATVEEVENAITDLHIVYLEPDNAIHWRLGDASGRQVVIEIVDGKTNIYENPIGVLGNAPGFPWQLENLNNYVNLYSGNAKPHQIGNQELKAFGAGSGFLGLPGDFTPPSRFVRATLFLAASPTPATAVDAMTQCFHLLHLFDIPIGSMYPDKTDVPKDLPSATQWTSVTDCTNRLFYYNTMYNNTIRVVDLKMIDFKTVQYQVMPIDSKQQQPIEAITINS